MEKDRNTLTTEQEIIQRCADYVEDLYNDTGRPFNRTPKVSRFMKVHIDKEEVESIIESLPERKATGTDEIPDELLWFMGNESIDQVTKIINNCYNTGELPEAF